MKGLEDITKLISEENKHIKLLFNVPKEDFIAFLKHYVTKQTEAVEVLRGKFRGIINSAWTVFIDLDSGNIMVTCFMEEKNNIIDITITSEESNK